MWTWLRVEKVKKCRKCHSCHECNRIINIGEPIDKTISAGEDTIFTHNMCDVCQAFRIYLPGENEENWEYSEEYTLSDINGYREFAANFEIERMLLDE
jgi:hypothetical protein